MRLLLFNKPFRVLTRFTSGDGRPTLARYLSAAGVYPAGRLDYDSEGLLLLTDDPRLRGAITEPGRALEKTYWVQVEGEPTDAALASLRRGIQLADGPTRPARARRIESPAGLWPREPPIRIRLRLQTAWLELAICEGRNRQVRRMTAAVGFPTLRLIRAAVGPFTVAGLAPGEAREAEALQAAAFRAGLLAVSGRARGVRSASPPPSPARSSAADRRWIGRPGRDRRR
ncbi:MAG TPA: pseudouridine synthase [Steroidobacteraceae bacterium]|nr:pseudouridine synthase [Steroidobacteraceae bacterium]